MELPRIPLQTEHDDCLEDAAGTHLSTQHASIFLQLGEAILESSQSNVKRAGNGPAILGMCTWTQGRVQRSRVVTR